MYTNDEIAIYKLSWYFVLRFVQIFVLEVSCVWDMNSLLTLFSTKPCPSVFPRIPSLECFEWRDKYLSDQSPLYADHIYLWSIPLKLFTELPSDLENPGIWQDAEMFLRPRHLRRITSYLWSWMWVAVTDRRPSQSKYYSAERLSQRPDLPGSPNCNSTR